MQMKLTPAVVVAVLAVGACGPEPEVSLGGGGGIGGTATRLAPDAPALWGSSVIELPGNRLAVADPESDSVFLVKGSSLQRLTFPLGSHPVRVVTAGDDVAVLLRGSGKVARLERPGSTGKIEDDELTNACSEPRGLAYDSAADAIIVACATGELVTVTKTERTVVDTGLELRDVLIIGGKRWVTTFRSASLVEVGGNGEVLTELSPPAMPIAAVSFTPRVAWRAVADGDRVVMVHQLHVVDEVSRLTNPAPGAPYYGRPYCSASVVSSALTVFDTKARTVAWSRPIIGALPVDLAVSPGHIAVAFAGAGQVLEYTVGDEAPPTGPGGCLSPSNISAPGVPIGVGYQGGELHSFDHSGRLVRGAANEEVALLNARVLDGARQLFHAQSPSGVSCGSCHPDGFDDGHTWQFGARKVRSQSLEGGLLATAPFHWDGRLRGVAEVLDETFVERMGGLKPDLSQANALGGWLDQLPARSALGQIDPAAAKRGRLAFTRAQCASCHAGERYTNRATVDVGTGGAFQVPSLEALRWRGPWMHNGCAKTLQQRFDPACGGARHGSAVPAEDLPDLVEFLKTL